MTKIDVWEWGMAQIISIPLGSHSSAIPEASIPQQQIPLEGSSNQLSQVFVAEGNGRDDQDLWK